MTMRVTNTLNLTSADSADRGGWRFGGAVAKHLLRVLAEHADWWRYVHVDLPTYAHNRPCSQRVAKTCAW